MDREREKGKKAGRRKRRKEGQRQEIGKTQKYSELESEITWLWQRGGGK